MAGKGFRSINVNDVDYKYKIGKDGVKIRGVDSNDANQFVNYVNLTGNAHANILMENRELEITPVIIAAYIRENISDKA